MATKMLNGGLARYIQKSGKKEISINIIYSHTYNIAYILVCCMGRCMKAMRALYARRGSGHGAGRSGLRAGRCGLRGCSSDTDEFTLLFADHILFLMLRHSR